jgi:hypothetical protein
MHARGPRPWRRDHEGGWMPGQPVGVDCGRKMNWREISMEAKPLQQWPVWWAGCVCVGEDGGAVLVVIAHGGQIN